MKLKSITNENMERWLAIQAYVRAELLKRAVRIWRKR